MEKNKENLDVEFKRYLQIIKPNLGQLTRKETIQICQEWIQRLNNCCEEEKLVRNKYIFVLCYQLAKGVLGEPFLNGPPTTLLPNIAEIAESNTSLEPENVVENENDNYIDIIEYYRNPNRSLSINKSYDQESSISEDCSKEVNTTDPLDMRDERSSRTSKKRNAKVCRLNEIHYASIFEKQFTDVYVSRANNLILRLRDIKKQNILLQNEVAALKEESGDRNSTLNSAKVDDGTCTSEKIESSTTFNMLKSQVKALSKENQYLLNDLHNMKIKLAEFEDSKKREFEEIKAQHEIEVAELKITIRDENKLIYERKVEELKNHYENIISTMKRDELMNVTTFNNSALTDIDKLKHENCKKLQEKDQEIATKKRELIEKDNIIYVKSIEIATLKSQFEDQIFKLQSTINQFLVTPKETLYSNNYKVKEEEFQKRLYKIEQSKAKCIQAYEAKLTRLRRDKHLGECSLSLQLVKHRAQVVRDLAEENQSDLASALDKLEAKYKNMVCNVQTAAIRRTLQENTAINSIIEATLACGFRNDRFKKKESQNDDTFNTDAVFQESLLKHSCAEEDSKNSFGLESEQLGKMFNKVYIPVKDINSLKK